MRVYRYDTDNGERHCREGMAVEISKSDLRDTFWGAYGSDRHKLTKSELDTAKFIFDTEDYDEITSYNGSIPGEWLDRAENDRETITSQRQLRVIYFIRTGSRPDFAMKVANASARVADAESEVSSAYRRLEWAVGDLAALMSPSTESVK